VVPVLRQAPRGVPPAVGAPPAFGPDRWKLTSLAQRTKPSRWYSATARRLSSST
jgi:hypothetical protein